MRRWTRFALALGLTCVSLLVVTACGGDDDGGATSSANISGTVTVWDPYYAAFPNIKKAGDRLDGEFERLHPGVTIDHVGQPFDQYDQLLRAAFTGRKTPDVAMMTPGPQGILKWTQGLEKLNDRISDEQRDAVRDSDWRAATAGLAEDGDIYGLPVSIDGIVFYYNKKLFAKAGLPTDFQPDTWEDVKEAGEKLKAAGIQPFTGGNKEGYDNSWWFSAGWVTANTPEDALAFGKGDLPYTDPKIEAALAPQKMMHDAGLFEDDYFSTPAFTEGLVRFGEGKAGMFLGFMSGVGHYGDYIPKLGEKNIGLFFPPGHKYVGLQPFLLWSIPSAAKNREAAWAYIEFLTSAASAETLYKVGELPPNRSDVDTAPGAPVQERVILEKIESSDTFQDVHQLMPAGVEFSTGFSEVLRGRESMEAFQQAQQEVAERGNNPLAD